MKNIPAFASAALVLLVTTPAIAGERLQFVERAMTDATLDLGAKGDSVGDLLTFANPVFDADNKMQVGRDQGFCVRVVVGKSWECFWTLTLATGQITLEGPFKDTGESLMAVTGGTGKYEGAKGQLKLHARDAQASAYDFTYELL